MSRDVEFVLRKLRFDIVNGVTQSAIEHENLVTGWKKSAVRSEFYSALQAGFEASAVFVMFADDYADEQEVVCDGQTYEVVRSYYDGLDRVELTCKKRDAK